MPALPGSLALTPIPDGALMVAADVRNNFTQTQTAVNALIALNGGSLSSLPERRLYDKVYKMVTAVAAPYPHVKWLTFGDSFAQLVARWYVPALSRAMGAVAGAYFGSDALIGGITTNATAGVVTDNTTDFDAWPSGLASVFATGASRTYGIGGSTFVCDTVKVYYVKGPASAKDGGTFKVQIDGVDSVVGVSTVNATIGLGVVSITPALGAHTVTVVATAGPIRIVGVGMENSTIRGIVPINVSQGGIALNQPLATAWANFQTFLADALPDVVTTEMKEDSSYYAAALVAFFNALTAGNPNMDVIGMGSSPVQTGDVDQVAQNAQLRTACQNYGFAYWDGYAPLKDWATVNALGWGTDPVHLTDKAHKYRASVFMRDFGLLQLIDTAYSYDVTAQLLKATTSVAIGKTLNDPMAKVVADQSFDNDLSVQVRRWTKWLSLDGVTEYGRIDHAGGGFSFMKFLRFGATGFAGIGGTDADTIFIAKGDTYLAPADVFLRRVRLASAAANVSGAVTADLSVAACHLLTLTGNVTSFAFSNGAGGEDIEVHFIQDATGSRTLAGVNASIKWAGAATPVLTLTAGRRDIFRFRNISGTFYEVSRSMNVG